MGIAYSNKRLESIRQRGSYPGAAQAGRLSIATALKNVSDTVEQLIVDVDHGQATKDLSAAVKDIDHLVMRLEAIRGALKPPYPYPVPHPFEPTEPGSATCHICGKYNVAKPFHNVTGK